MNAQKQETKELKEELKSIQELLVEK